MKRTFFVVKMAQNSIAYECRTRINEKKIRSAFALFRLNRNHVGVYQRSDTNKIGNTYFHCFFKKIVLWRKQKSEKKSEKNERKKFKLRQIVIINRTMETNNAGKSVVRFTAQTIYVLYRFLQLQRDKHCLSNPNVKYFDSENVSALLLTLVRLFCCCLLPRCLRE